ncbi:hypothetical protein BXZ70DRAFT_60083 [Cristinia sonorae]|uniref:DUF6533 domain-containing protein n=1 Tax=Cristinia sonorae TaxID=1940300 RepID=A0A8K0XR56_9AGAR|nr:hypothetical protein BXZ70DRAFT_60083 [Cristinia sonorae]
MHVSAAALLVYDIFLTLDDEVRYIWPSKISLVKLLYFATRYLAILDRVAGLYHQFQANVSNSQCKMTYIVGSWAVVVGIVIAESILMLRTWVIWGRSTKIALLLIVLFGGAILGVVVIDALFLKTLTFKTFPDPSIPSCVLSGASPTIGATFIILIAVETLVLILTLIKGIERFRVTGTARTRGLIFVLYRDGILFYVYLLGISVLNFILTLNLPYYRTDLLIGIQRVLHGCLSARILLHLREAAIRDRGVTNMMISLNVTTTTTVHVSEENTSGTQVNVHY